MNSSRRGSSTPVEHELGAPGAGDDRAGEAVERGEHHVGVGDGRLERGDLVGRQVRAVGHPDGAVLERVHGELVGHRLGVDPAVQPGRGVVAADRRGLLVGHRLGGVVAGHRVGLDRVERRPARDVVPDGEPDDAGDEQHHGGHRGDQDDPGAPFLGPLRLTYLVDLGPTGLAATLRPGRLAHAGAPHCGTVGCHDERPFSPTRPPQRVRGGARTYQRRGDGAP